MLYLLVQTVDSRQVGERDHSVHDPEVRGQGTAVVCAGMLKRVAAQQCIGPHTDTSLGHTQVTRVVLSLSEMICCWWKVPSVCDISALSGWTLCVVKEHMFACILRYI